MFHLIKKFARWVWRSSISGKFVTDDYAKDHPDTTTKEQVK